MHADGSCNEKGGHVASTHDEMTDTFIMGHMQQAGKSRFDKIRNAVGLNCVRVGVYIRGSSDFRLEKVGTLLINLNSDIFAIYYHTCLEMSDVAFLPCQIHLRITC